MLDPAVWRRFEIIVEFPLPEAESLEALLELGFRNAVQVLAPARRFVAEGAKVVLGDIQEAEGAAVAEELGEHAVFLTCNVTREDDVAGLVAAAVDHFGALDVMYNNAGVVGAVGPIAETPLEEWQRTLDIHLNGSFLGCKHAARVMMGQGSGSITD